MPITSEQLANLLVMRVIFHDVPSMTRGSETKRPTLSEIDTKIDNNRKALLKKKLVQALSSRAAYPVLFDQNKSATVANQIKVLTTKDGDGEFINSSQVMAQELFSKQSGAVSSGLLCVIDARLDSQRCVIVMKLERHEGAQLKMGEDGGKKTFSMQVLDDLVLTEGTRLFKTAVFVRNASGSEEFSGLACDSQLSVSANTHMALFWLNFLGCKFVVDPRIATQRFFDSTLAFVNAVVSDASAKSQIYDSLQSEFKSAKLTFSPRKFMEEYVPSNHQAMFEEHLTENGIPMTQFHKDLTDIERRLKFLRYETKGGAIISVPVSESELVVIDDETITIKDPVTKVK